MMAMVDLRSQGVIDVVNKAARLCAFSFIPDMIYDNMDI